MIEAQDLVAPAATDKRRLITVRGLARDCMYIEAHLIDRFEDSGMTVDIATGMPRVADKTLENFSRHLTVHQRNQSNDIVSCTHEKWTVDRE